MSAPATCDIEVDLAAVRSAHARIAPHIHRTPVLSSGSLDDAVGSKLFFKCENLQRVAAFKARGACNAVLSLSAEEAKRGVVTHSSGNHGAALAWAARLRGIPAWIVMPSNAAQVKLDAVKEPTVAAREATCAAVEAETGATLIHPYNDWRVIAGQGTAALELLEDEPDLDAVITPVGGGGLLSGTAIVAKGVRPSIKVYGAEPAGADDAYRSLRAGRIIPQTDPRTIADGLRSSLGDKTFAVLSTNVDAIETASEEAIVRAMRLLWEKLKMIVEPSSAVPLAVLLERKISLDGLRVGIILSGGNVDLDHLPWQT
ncbi:MAG: pyridoxal-phosphate dependent enzyme [Betaproteobacteria bacterium]|nr:MAG: pyridoxal-phosphate dependent enzyme [Betaproteobacteria bacterium]